MAYTAQFPISSFLDVDGKPLENGYVYIGTAGLDPVGNPITVYWDAAATQVAAQPIRTIGGYPSNNGVRSRLYVNAVDYSIKVTNVNGTDTVPVALYNAEDAYAADIIFLQAGAGAVARTVESKLRESVSVKDFGAVGDGVTDDTVAIQNAVNASRNVYFPQQSGPFYKCSSPITLRQDSIIKGETKQNTVVKFFGCAGFIASSAGAGAYDIQIQNISIIGDGVGATSDGIRIDGTASNFGRVSINNVVIGYFAQSGLSFIRPIVSQLCLVSSSFNGAHGFYINGDGTSVYASSCYANGNGGDGWLIRNNIQYSAFDACASDNNAGIGWHFDGSILTPAEGICLTSCGSESNGGDYFKFVATLGLTLTGCFVFPGSPAAGGNYINLDGCRHVSLNGIRMDAPPAVGKYALNIGTLGGTQFPTNIRGIGCSFVSINNANEAYAAFTENTASAWIAPTLVNGWVNFGGTESTAGYYKDQFGVVHLRGTIKDGAFSSACFNLPAGYRPAANSNRNYGTVSNAAFGMISVSSNGNVTPTVGSTAYISLDGISFLANA